MGKKKKVLDEPEGVIRVAENRRARRDWEIEETIEAGLELMGTEVKSLRAKQVSFDNAYAIMRGHEMFMLGLTIDKWSHGTHGNHEPERTRRLLLNRAELDRIEKATKHRAVSVIPLKVYFKNGWAKVLLGLGKGRKTQDKREIIKRREADRDMERALRNR